MNNDTKDFALTLDGFFKEYKEASLPNQSGIYFVFGGSALSNDKCRINHLIYIGESQDVQYRLTHHEKKPEFKDALEEGEILYYAYTLVSSCERELCEKGLIKHFSNRFGKDIINKLSTKYFDTNYAMLSYNLSGAVPRIFGESDRNFLVEPKD